MINRPDDATLEERSTSRVVTQDFGGVGPIIPARVFKRSQRIVVAIDSDAAAGR
jgi:hypothetical protein